LTLIKTKKAHPKMSLFNVWCPEADKTTGVVLDRGSDPQGEAHGWAESIEQGSMPHK